MVNTLSWFYCHIDTAFLILISNIIISSASQQLSSGDVKRGIIGNLRNSSGAGV